MGVQFQKLKLIAVEYSTNRPLSGKNSRIDFESKMVFKLLPLTKKKSNRLTFLQCDTNHYI